METVLWAVNSIVLNTKDGKSVDEVAKMWTAAAAPAKDAPVPGGANAGAASKKKGGGGKGSGKGNEKGGGQQRGRGDRGSFGERLGRQDEHAAGLSSREGGGTKHNKAEQQGQAWQRQWVAFEQWVGSSWETAIETD